MGAAHHNGAPMPRRSECENPPLKLDSALAGDSILAAIEGPARPFRFRWAIVDSAKIRVTHADACRLPCSNGESRLLANHLSGVKDPCELAWH